MGYETMNEWEGTGGTALLEHDALSPMKVPPGSEKHAWTTPGVLGFDDDLDEDESYFLEADDDEDDDGYDDDDGGAFDEDEDEDVDVEIDDDDDDDL